jgi:hypothetical protein
MNRAYDSHMAPSGIDRVMLQNRTDEALFIRRRALHQLRMGDRLGHKLTMSLTRLPLLMARSWKPKGANHG